jgi:hypothetical protein
MKFDDINKYIFGFLGNLSSILSNPTKEETNQLKFLLEQMIPENGKFCIFDNNKSYNTKWTRGLSRVSNILNIDFNKKKEKIGNKNIGKDGLREILKYLGQSKNFKRLTRGLDEKYLKNFSLNIGEVGIDDIRKLIKDLYNSNNFIERCMLLDNYLTSYNSTFYKFADGTLYSRINNKTKSSKSEAFTYIFYDLYKIGKKNNNKNIKIINKINLAEFKKELNKYKNKNLYKKNNSIRLLTNEKLKIKENNKLKNKKITEINKRIKAIGNFNNFKENMKEFQVFAKELNKNNLNKRIEYFEKMIKNKGYTKFYTPRLKYLKKLRNITKYIENNKTFKLEKGKNYTKEELEEKRRKISKELANLETKFQNGKVDKKKRNNSYELLYPKIEYLKDLYNLTNYIDKSNLYEGITNNKINSLREEYNNLSTQSMTGEISKNVRPGSLYNKVKYLRHKIGKYDKKKFEEKKIANKAKRLANAKDKKNAQVKAEKNAIKAQQNSIIKARKDKRTRQRKPKQRMTYDNKRRLEREELQKITPKKKFQLTLNNNTKEWATMGEYSNEEYNNLKKREAALKNSKSPNSITNKLNLRNNNASLINESYKNRDKNVEK